jgi:uroporphyrinogen-III synthase
MDRSRRVWVTRDEGTDGPLCAALRSRGLEAVLERVIERRVVADVAPQLAQLGPSDWLVLTSPFAIESLPPGRWECRVAVVGEASRQSALARGLRVELVSENGSGAGLWGRLREMTSRGVVLHPRSGLATPPAAWGAVRIEAPVLYRTLIRDFDPSVARRVAAAAVASASAARAIIGVSGLPRVASIGPSTSAALRAGGVTPWVEAPAPTLDALAGGIAAGLDQLRSDSGSSRHHRA